MGTEKLIALTLISASGDMITVLFFFIIYLFRNVYTFIKHTDYHACLEVDI